MLVTPLFVLLPLLALVQAAPHKRQCPSPTAGGTARGRPTEGSPSGGNNFLHHSGTRTHTRARTQTGQQGTRTVTRQQGTPTTATGVDPVGDGDGGPLTSTTTRTGSGGNTGQDGDTGPTTGLTTTSGVPTTRDDPGKNPAPAPTPTVTGGGSGGGGGSGNGGGGEGGAVGLAINEQSGTNLASFGGKLSWYYNWAVLRANIPNLEFVPMIWGEDAANHFGGNVGGAKYIMGFNEPDMTRSVGGSDIPAGRAADLHKAWTAKVPAGVQIGAPGVARGGFAWMDAWVAACGGGCKYDFVPYHFYGTSAADLISYTKEFHGKYGKPLWLTEWACHDYVTGKICTDAEVRAFMTSAISFFEGEGKSMVARWSYFGAFPNHAQTNANGLMNTDGSANDLGKFYASL